MASKSLGTLTIDLIAKVGGFVSGMDKAERASDKWRKQVQKNVEGASKALAGMAAAAAAAGTAVGIAGYQLLKSTSNQMAEADRWAKSLNMSTQELLAWQFAAEKAGLSADNMADIFKDLGDKIGDAVLNKSGEAVDALNALGLSADKLSKVSPDKQLLAIGEALGKINTNAEKTTILESMGNDLSKMLPLFDNNNEKLKQFIQLSKDYGVAPNPDSIDDLVKVNALFENMESQVKGLKIEIASGLAKVDLSPLQGSLDKLQDVLTDPQVLQGIVNLVSEVAELAGWLVKAAASAGDLAVKVSARHQGVFGTFSDNNVPAMQERIKFLQMQADNAKPGGTWLGNILGNDDSLEHYQKEIAKLQGQIEKVNNSARGAMKLPLGQATIGNGEYSLGNGESNGKPSAPKIPKSSGSSKAIESAFKSTEQSYIRQIALTDQLNGKTKEATELEKLRLDISSGKLVGINKQQQARLEGLAAEIDRFKLLEKYRGLQEELLTPEEKLLESTRERVKLLKDAKDAGLTNDDDYAKASKAIANNAFEKAPEFGGIDPIFGGQLGELRKVDKAQGELEEWYSTQLNMLDEYRQSQSELNEQWDAKELELRKQHADSLQSLNDQRNQLMLSSVSDGLGSVVDVTKSAFGEQSAIYKAAFVAQKAAAIAQSAIAIQQGIAMAAANPFPLNLAAMASVAAATAGIVSNISAIGMAHDGLDSVPETGTWLLQKGERVTTAKTSAKLDATLDRVGKQSVSGVMPVNNIVVNGDPDKSTIRAIEEAVARGEKRVYGRVTGDVATGRGDMSKALMAGWNTKRRAS